MSANSVLGSGNSGEPASASSASSESPAVSEVRYHRLFETAKDGILILDAETGMVIDANPFLTELIGYSHEEFIGKTIWELGFLKDVIANRDKFLELQRREYVRYENLPLETVDGHRRDVEFVSNVYQEGSRSVVQCNIRDITQRKLSEAQQRSTSLFLSTLLEAIPAPVFYKDTEGRYIGFNKAFEAFYGKKSCDMVGKTVFEVASPEMASLFHDRDVELFRHPGVQVYSAKMKDGQGLVHDVVYHKATFNNADGQVAGLIGVILDTTEHVRLEEQFRQVQKMEAIGRLAGGVAHDFNNMLGIILGHTEMALEQIGPDQTILSDLQAIQLAAERSAILTRQLLAFARKQTIMPVYMDLNKSVSLMLKLLQRLIHEDINLVWLPGSDLHTVKLDPSQVDQLLTNLCINARDAITGVGTIILETGNITIDDAFCARHPEAVPGEYVFLAVHDDGAGMAPETLAHIFEPFFTTKGIGQGTGLGLATVYGIVKQNNGLIHASSRPGKGTTFLIYLPEAVAETRPPDDVVKTPSPRGCGETVLLVEDEQSLRNLCQLFLNALGYNVLAAECPGDALEQSERYPGDIGLLLTDVVMPGMAVTEMVRRIRTTRPGINVLFMSGYTADVIAQHGVLEKRAAFIAKPFTRDEFARKVRATLEGSLHESSADLS